MVATLDQVFREEWGRVLATLIGFLGDFDLAEEAAQEAFAIAADRWPRDGVPSNPRAWLMTTARNRATDRIRRDRALAAKVGLLAADNRAEVPMNTTTFPDERLELIFTCCHPALAVEAQVALTLRTLGGLTHRRDRPCLPGARSARWRSGWCGPSARSKPPAIPFRVPPAHLLRERLDAVLAVVYLIFNEGYGGRDELAAEAIWLGRALAELLPDEPEVHGLLAMMLLHDSRREARFRDGELVLLGDQDRSRWNTEQIAAGRAELDRALALGGRGPYVLQAAIASLHAEMPCDWAQIAALYGELARLTGSPVVELNRAIAIAETEGPEAGLRIVDQLGLDDFRYLHSTRAELLRRLGRTDEARDAYRRARAAHRRRRRTALPRTPANGTGRHHRLGLSGLACRSPSPWRAAGAARWPLRSAGVREAGGVDLGQHAGRQHRADGRLQHGDDLLDALLAERRQAAGPGPLVGARFDGRQHGLAVGGDPGDGVGGEQAAAVQRAGRGGPVLLRPAAGLPDHRLGEAAVRGLQQVRLQPADAFADQGRDVPVAAVLPQRGGQLPEPADRVAGRAGSRSRRWRRTAACRSGPPWRPPGRAARPRAHRPAGPRPPPAARRC